MKHQIGNIYSQVGKTARYYILSVVEVGDKPKIALVNIGSGAIKDEPLQLPNCFKSTFENITDEMISKLSDEDEMEVLLEAGKLNDVLYKLENKKNKKKK